MTKKIIAAILAAIMLLSTSIAFAAETANTNGKQYYLDLEMVDDKTFTESSVDLVLNINGEETILYKDGRTQKPDGTIVNEADLGSAILFDYRPNGKLDEASMPITFVPIRRIAQALSKYGVRIDWDSENAVVVLDTSANGRIQFPIGATSIEANGTTYEETTYRFPVRPGQSVGDPINIVSSRQGRTFVTVRFLSSLLIENCNFSWKGTERLTVNGTMEKGSGVEKTYGINENYISQYGDVDLEALPTLMEVAKSVGAEVNYSLLDLESINGHGATNRLHINADSGEINVSGYCPLGDNEAQLNVLEAMLTDLVNDADKDAIMAKLKEVGAKLMDGWNKEDGYTQVAKDWRDATEKEPITFNEVVLTWEPTYYLSSFSIKTK